jgi:alanine dehydrogenase
MDGTKNKPGFASIITESQPETKAELQGIHYSSSKLFIGIPKQENLNENRVALSPMSVKQLVGRGHRVVIENGAGERSGFSNSEYSEAGAEVAYSKKEVFLSSILITVSPPSDDEIELLHADQILISPLHLPLITREFLMKLKQKRVIALAMEYLQDDDGSYPLVRIMSEMAGLSAVLTAAELLSRPGEGSGILLGGVSGVPPAKVLILGAGVVGEFATRTAMGLGAEVRIFDNNIYKLMRIKSRLGQFLYTSSINMAYLQDELLDADVAIGAIHSKLGRTPMIVTEDMIQRMKPGSVIVDVSIDQGGCFETSVLTSHQSPTFIKHGVIHYCVPNISSRFPRTASFALSNILSPILQKAGQSGSLNDLFYIHTGLRRGIYIYKGSLTNAYLGERFALKYSDVDLLLTSRL